MLVMQDQLLALMLSLDMLLLELRTRRCIDDLNAAVARAAWRGRRDRRRLSFRIEHPQLEIVVLEERNLDDRRRVMVDPAPLRKNAGVKPRG